jgi:hypothetical protein
MMNLLRLILGWVERREAGGLKVAMGFWRLQVFFVKAELHDLLIDHEHRVAGLAHAHPAQHLADTPFNVLVVDAHALQTVDRQARPSPKTWRRQ